MPKPKRITNTLALYIHIPFCQHICPYCGFYKVKNQPDLENSLITALKKEMKFYCLKFQLPPIHSIFIGGGTPSLLSQKALAQLFKAMNTLFSFTPNCEITIELNPENVSNQQLTHYKKLGINRLSIGIQSFNTQDLKFLGRHHSVETNINALTTITQHDNWNYNIDLITGLPNLNLTQLAYSLDQTILFNPTHISTYTLSIEPQTLFEKQQILPLDQSIEVTHYDYIANKLKAQNYIHYEISAFAKKNHESCHNYTYWRYLPFIGLGPSANSFFDQRRYSNISSVTEYIKKPTPELPNPIDIKVQIQEFLIANLRLQSGFKLSTFYQRFKLDFTVYFSTQLTQLINSELIIINNDTCKTTTKGRLLLNEVLLILI